MIDFANLASPEREVYFQQTAERTGLSAHLVEKDFWVCFTLQQLFDAPELSQYLTFKGGTSLSKVFKAIDRFSEDIDFAVSRDCLGFGGQAAPDFPDVSAEERKRRLVRLGEACHGWTQEELVPILLQRFKGALTSSNWNIELISEQSGNQQILFHYPQSNLSQSSGYNPSRVRVELTARTDNHPSIKSTVRPFVAEQFPDAIGNSIAEVEVLRAERTFWEKATILHQFHFQSDPQKILPGFSRHYYDVYQLAKRGFADRAMEEPLLLTEVADHKCVFYRQAWARYDLARDTRTLELIPHVEVQAAIASDYSDMHEMIFGEPPTFSEILEELRKLKASINALG